MPVVGIPVASPPVSGLATCSDQVNITPRVATVFGCDVKGRRRAVETYQGLTPTIPWTLIDPTGNPINLSTCGDFDGVDGSAVNLRIRESAYAPQQNNDLFEIEGTVTSLSEGGVSFVLTTNVTQRPGVYLAEATVVNSDGDSIFANQFYLVVNRSLGSTSMVTGGAAPSIAEIRLHLRDSDPAENSLLDTIQFDVAEIAMAIEYPVLYWNESNPPICQNYNTHTFPFRFWWLEAIVSRLYISAAHWYRRNHLPYQAGGVAVDDLNKADDYEKIGQQKWAEFKDFVLKKKVGFNLLGAITSSGTGYGGYF